MFFFRKKNNENKLEPSCCCRGTEKEKDKVLSCCEGTISGTGDLKILGSGCKSCHQLYENTVRADENLNLNIEVEYITDMEKILSYGVMRMPALVINEKVVSSGKVLNTEEIGKIISNTLEGKCLS